MKDLIEKSKKLTALLEEYEFAKLAEAHDYFIEQVEFYPQHKRDRFGVIRITTGEIVFYNTLAECERYCAKRKLKALFRPQNQIRK